MTTLLVAGSRRCSRRCYDAEGPVCDCPACGGRLHGVGRDRALELAPELVEPGTVAMLELPLAAGRAVEGGRALVDAAAKKAQTVTVTAAERMGNEVAATQSTAVATAEYAFTEELAIAWFRIEEIAHEVLTGRRDLGGMTPGEQLAEEATDANR